MAHYGIQAQVTAKTASKRAPGVEKSLLSWIFEVIGEPVPENQTYEETLKDGVVICKLMNKLKPGAIDKVGWKDELSWAKGLTTCQIEFDLKSILFANILTCEMIKCLTWFADCHQRQWILAHGKH